jgi:phosphate transport system permease protein
MEAAGIPSAAAPEFAKRRLRDRIGDAALYAITLLAAVGSVVLLGLIAWKIINGAHLAFSSFGLGFLTSSDWNPVALASHAESYGALPLIFGTAVTSLIALVIATPLAIAIALYLSELAPAGIRGAVSTMIEMLAAIPSVVLGFWGILVLGPFMQDHLEPWLQSAFGFLPIFSGTPSETGLLPAGLILSIMVLPIIASICRELFLAVPEDMQEGALALGTTRWEMIRGVILPASRSGIAAAVILGLGRALGEAIAVIQVIGNQTGPAGIHRSLFGNGGTLAGQIANLFQGAETKLQTSTLFYLAVILLAIGIATNLLAQWVVGRFELKTAD